MEHTNRWGRGLERRGPAMLALALSAFLGAVQAGYCDGITKGADLEFGVVVPYAGGTVTVSPAGVRDFTGGALLVTHGATPQAATFTVTGAPYATYGISLPPDGTVMLRDNANHDMAVDTFRSSPNASGALNGDTPGTQTLRVGATLHIAAQQAVGQYAGSYDVTIAFN